MYIFIMILPQRYTVDNGYFKYSKCFFFDIITRPTSKFLTTPHHSCSRVLLCLLFC